MKDIQRTSLLGMGGFAVALTAAKTIFQDVPLNELFTFIQTLPVDKALDVIIPLALGAIGLFYNENSDMEK